MLEAWADPHTEEHLRRTGVEKGWRCLEVGAGAGSVTRWLAGEVGDEGAVVAADLNPRFLRDPPDNVEVRQLDISHDELESGEYDLVHSRLLLLHVPDPAAALEKMAGALKPGGWLVTEEADWGLFDLDGHPDAEWAAALVHDLFSRHADTGVRYPYFGRRLPGLVGELHLDGFDASGHTDVASGDALKLYRLTFAALARLNMSVGASAKDLKRLMKVLESPSVVLTGVSIITTWGRKP